MKKYGTEVKEISHIDPETGELVIHETHKKYRIPHKQEDFYTIFAGFFAAIHKISRSADIRVMVALCEMGEFNTGIVHLNYAQRKLVADRSGVGYSNLPKNLRRLEDAGVISIDKGDCLINPDIFWRGSISKRKEVMGSASRMISVEFVSD